MFLAFVTHDTKNNTLEASWLEPIFNQDFEIDNYKVVKRRNYSPEQKSEFESDCGPGSSKYTTMAGW